MLSRPTGIAVFVMNNSKVVCLGVAVFGFLFTVAAPTYAGTTKSTSTTSSSFVSTNFDFDHADISTPASYFNGGGTNTVYVLSPFRVAWKVPRMESRAHCPAELQMPEPSTRSWEILEFPATTRPETFCLIAELRERRASISLRSQHLRSASSSPKQGFSLAAPVHSRTRVELSLRQAEERYYRLMRQGNEVWAGPRVKPNSLSLSRRQGGMLQWGLAGATRAPLWREPQAVATVRPSAPRATRRHRIRLMWTSCRSFCNSFF